MGTTVDRSYIGKGTIYLREFGASNGLQPIGNVSALGVSFEEEKKTLKNYKNASGGNANVLSSITGMTASLTMHDYSAENMALALRGSVTAIAAGAVTDEAHETTGTGGELIPFDFTYDKSQSVTVTLTAGGACTEGTDYNLTPNGLTVIGAGAIDASGIKVTYTKAPGEVMEALIGSGKEFELFFDGLNEAQSGKAVGINMHRIKFSPAQGLGFISDEFAEIALDFEVLSDSTINAQGISQYMKVTQAI